MNQDERDYALNYAGLNAHSPNRSGKWHKLGDHLTAVSDLAGQFASKWGAGEIGRTLGLAHDLGKAAPEFQNYLNACEAKMPTKSSPHSDPSAVAVRDRLGPFALCVQGHHSGLPNNTGARDRQSDADRIAVSAGKELSEHLEWPTTANLREVLQAVKINREVEHLIRMCFSALVDADFLDTESHFDPSAQRGGHRPISLYLERLEAFLALMPTEETTVNRVRREVQNACRENGSRDPGFFRLTVPTGGGKTLSSLLFALRHAHLHGLERVIVAIPFLSIVEQTADVYRAAFGDLEVLEHHSGTDYDPDSENDPSSIKARLSAENWDCPIVVTTNVQLFESLLSNRTSKCRKLHNIARSVVILDETQALPPNLIQPAFDVLRWMVNRANTSVVLCTATQPDYSGVPDVGGDLSDAREIVPDPASLFERLKRVEFLDGGSLTHPALAARFEREPQALVIVNTRRDSADLMNAVPGDDTFYLSSWLCPDHRRMVLAVVKQRLADRLPVKLVATQVVEAGVDVDFPVVYREFAPLDSVIQAGGRCNRNGILPSGLGQCHIFHLEGTRGKLVYDRASTDETRAVIPDRIGVLESPTTQAEFFRNFFKNTSTDREVKGGAAPTLQGLREQFNFPEVAANSKLIDDDTVSAAIYSYSPRAIDDEFAALANGKSPRKVARILGRCSVSVRKSELGRLVREQMIEEREKGFYVWTGPYDSVLGIGVGMVYDP